MMGNARSVLRGVTCRDTRDTLEELVDQGWKPEHSRGGHIKLTHEDAAHPIISSKTPSTARGRLNLKADARRAIKLGRSDILSTTLLHSAIPPLEPANIEGIPAAPSERLKKRWSKERRQAELAKEKKFLPAAPAPALDLKSSLSPSLIRSAALAKAVVPTVEAPAAADKKVRAADTPATAGSPTSAKKPKRSTAPKPKTSPVALQEPSTTRAQAGVQVIEADVMALAMRILSGQVATLRITPEMVGMTLVHEGAVQLVAGSVPSFTAEPQPLPEPRAASPARAVAPQAPVNVRAPRRAKPTAAADAQRRFDLVRTALAVDPGAWLTHIDVADLISDEAAYGCRRSLMGATKRMLATLVRSGEVEVDERAGEMTGYRPARVA